VVPIGKGEHHHGSVFWPSRGLFPGTILFQELRLSFITTPVALLEIHHMQAPQVFLKSLAN